MFKGTRVPVKALIDHLKAGESLDYFLEEFSSVSRDQAITFLEFALIQAIGSNISNPLCLEPTKRKEEFNQDMSFK